MSAARSKGERLRALAVDLEHAANAFDQPSRSLVRADALIARVEGIASEVRAVVRGRG